MNSIEDVRALLTKAHAQFGSAAGVGEESLAILGELCRDARSRFDECDRLKSAGNIEKAVLLAEESPELLELVERVGRIEALAGWAEFASRSGLPSVPVFVGDSADRLIALYRSWDKSSEFLWRKYRDTMMRRDEDAAVLISQRIFRIDPSDRNARDEVNRVGRRVFKEKLKGLEEDLECGDEAAAIALVTQLDRIPFNDLKVGAAWDSAIKMRDAQQRKTNQKVLAGLVAALPGLRASGDLEGIQGVLSRAEEMVRRQGLDPGDDGKQQLAESKSWIKAEKERLERTAKLGAGAAVERCRGQVSKIEVVWAQLNSGPTSEAESALRKLDNCWAEVEGAGIDPGAELRDKVASWRKQLKAKLSRDASRVRRRALVIKVVIGVVVFAASYYLYAQWRGGRIVDKLVELQSERKAVAVKSTLDRAEKWSWPVIYLARVRPEVDRSHAWYGREDQHRQRTAATASDLEGSMVDDFEGPATTEFHGKMEILKREIADVAIDMQPGLKTGTAGLFEAWDAHVAAFVIDRQKKRESALAELTESLDTMPGLSAAGRDDEFSQRLASTAADLDKWMLPTIPEAIPRAEIADGVRALRPRLSQQLERVAAFRRSLKGLREARHFTAYFESIGRFSRNGLLQDTPERDAAVALLKKEPTEDRLIGQVLAPADPDGWDFYLANRGKSDLFPSVIADSERQILQGLRDDKNLSNIYVNRFRKRPEGGAFRVHSIGEPAEKTRKAGATFIEYRGNFFDGVDFRDQIYTLKAGRGDELVSIGLSSESILFEKIHPVRQLMSQSQQYYQRGLLPVFEEIATTTGADPLYRAHVQAKFVLVLLERPHEWGSVLSPLLMADLAELKQLGARNLSSRKWLAQDIAPERIVAFREFYQRAAGHRYAVEAKLNRSLIGKILEAGAGYAGFVDVDGALVLQPNLDSATELYGHADPKQPARLLLRRSSPDIAEWEEVENGAPLSALIYFKADRKQVLEEVAAELGMSIGEAETIAMSFCVRE